MGGTIACIADANNGSEPAKRNGAKKKTSVRNANKELTLCGGFFLARPK